MGNSGRYRDRDREFDDHDEGNRHGDRENIHQPDRYATGQSGYSAGRDDDRALGYQTRNQSYSPGSFEDRQVFGTDERFMGRGGEEYLHERGARHPRSDRDREREGYAGPMYGYGRSSGGYGGSSYQGDYGPSESERGVWYSDFGYGRQGPGQGRVGGYTRDVHDVRGMGPSDQRLDRFDTRPEARAVGPRPSGPYRGVGPRGYNRSDDRIKEAVCEALTEDDQIDASGIEVEVKAGEVTISGTVPDREMKRWAEDCAARIAGVRDVANQLKVAERDRGRGNQGGNGTVGTHDPEPRKGDDKKARA